MAQDDARQVLCWELLFGPEAHRLVAVILAAVPQGLAHQLVVELPKAYAATYDAPIVPTKG